MASDLLGAMKEIYLAAPALVTATPGGWHLSRGPKIAQYPYITVKTVSGPLAMQTSTSNVDDVRIRLRIWHSRMELIRPVADLVESTFKAAAGLNWTGGWSTPLRRMDRIEIQEAGRAPQGQGLLRAIELVFLANVRRDS